MMYSLLVSKHGVNNAGIFFFFLFITNEMELYGALCNQMRNIVKNNIILQVMLRLLGNYSYSNRITG